MRGYQLALGEFLSASVTNKYIIHQLLPILYFAYDYIFTFLILLSMEQKEDTHSRTSSRGDLELGGMFEEDKEEYFASEEQQIVEYNIEDLQVSIKSKKVNFGISRVVWSGSLVMAQYLKQALRDHILGDKLRIQENHMVLELGAGTGLGGIFAQKILKADKIFLTDICPQSVQLMKENARLNQKDSSKFSCNLLDWANPFLTVPPEPQILEVNDDTSFPSEQHFGSFDLILASDVIYFAGILQPLAGCMAKFLKPNTGRCIFVNDLARYECFSDRFEILLTQYGFQKLLVETPVYEGKFLSVQILQLCPPAAV